MDVSDTGRYLGSIRITRHEISMSKTPPIRHRFTTDAYFRMAQVGILGEDDRVELPRGSRSANGSGQPPKSAQLQRKPALSSTPSNRCALSLRLSTAPGEAVKADHPHRTVRVNLLGEALQDIDVLHPAATARAVAAARIQNWHYAPSARVRSRAEL